MQNNSAQLKIVPHAARHPRFTFFALRFSFQHGYAALTTILLVLFSSLSIIGGLTLFAFREVITNRAFTKSIDARAIADAGVEDALYRIMSGKQIGVSETLNVGKGVAAVTITAIGNVRIIRSTGTRENLRQSAESALDLAATGSSFIYGVQVGNGGIEMKNTSSIVGSVYANGNIVGENTPMISGDALAAGTSAISGSLAIGGNAYAYLLAGDPQITVGGAASSTTAMNHTIVGTHAMADTFDDSVVNQNAYYKTFISADTVVLGSSIPISEAPPQLPAVPMPIPDSKLDEWETDAAAGGTHTSPCPYVLSSGTTVIGPKKIACDMDIKGTAIVTLTGTLWVAGNLTIQNSAVVRLHPSFGILSGMVVVDDPSNRSAKGVLEVKNSAQILGSGAPGSYLMLVSRNNSAEIGGSTDAVNIQNTSAASIYYAPHGSVSIQNNTYLKEVTAYKLKLQNSASVTYESGLSDIKFTSGPSGGYEMKYWKEVK